MASPELQLGRKNPVEQVALFDQSKILGIFTVFASFQTITDGIIYFRQTTLNRMELKFGIREAAEKDHKFHKYTFHDNPSLAILGAL